MKTKLLLSAIFGVAAWSLSSVAMAAWSSGPCPATTSPCIEVVDSGNTYHFNGGQQDIWHGHPTGGDFEFANSGVELGCPGINPSCDLVLYGQVKKCEDSDGNWRLGVKVTGGDSSGGFVCNALNLSGFPWYSADPAGHSHPGQCPFTDDCDNFLPYVPNASNYVGHFGEVTVSSFFGTHVNAEHVHNVTFTPNNGSPTPSTANFNFTGKTFTDCSGDGDCTIDGILYLDNADALNVY